MFSSDKALTGVIPTEVGLLIRLIRITIPTELGQTGLADYVVFELLQLQNRPQPNLSLYDSVLNQSSLLMRLDVSTWYLCCHSIGTDDGVHVDGIYLVVGAGPWFHCDLHFATWNREVFPFLALA
ncbi:expressed unknown protein [Seminavis robusta]|uniref:Uncharacterized protein n=1 Tax=Seminavis robusta TaxID=568900 RepID=A0A9N8F300_9STRA|nr:expressed unknown protein [Seminavis robusta]|eukprot:Sro4409_g353931.1  (125) ;mRNA; r:317-691